MRANVVANLGNGVGRIRVIAIRKEGAPMRKIYGVSFCLLVGFGRLAGSANAKSKNGSQPTELNLPRVSQRASVTQRIGLTDVTIVYHAPLVGGRPIWDKQVPYGKVWRAGANE